jgi:hypothetical protein
VTYADAYARDGGTFEFFLRIDGIKYILGTSSLTPDIAGSNGHSYLKGLKADSLRLSCSANPGEVWPDVPVFEAEFIDIDETLSAYLKSIESENTIRTELTDTLAAGDAIIKVGDTSRFAAAPSVVYVDQEAIAYAVKTATQFQNLTRGYMGSTDADHDYDVGIFPPVAPEVSDGPGDLKGHRAVIFAAEVVNGALSATSQIWVGDVAGYLDFSAKRVRIPLRHMVRAYAEGKIFGAPPVATMRGLYVPNWDGIGRGGDPFGAWGHFSVQDADAGYADLSPVAEGSATFYATSRAMVDAWISAVNTPAINWEAGLNASGYAYITYTGPDFGKISGEGTMSQLLGFDNLVHTAAIETDQSFTAVNKPATFFFPVVDAFASLHTSRIYVGVGEAAQFRETGVNVESEFFDTQTFEIVDVNTTSDYLEVIAPRLLGAALGGGDPIYNVMSRGSERAPTVRQVWDFNAPLQDAIRITWQGKTYAGAPAFGYTAPVRWLPSPAMNDTDVDWTALKTLCDAGPVGARSVQVAVTEPKEVTKLFMGHLAACGIYAYVKSDGKVGWNLARVPAVGETPTTVDSSLILAREAANIETMYGRDKLMNIAQFELTTSIGIETIKRKVLVVDRLSVQRYGPSMARDASDPANDAAKKATKLRLYALFGASSFARIAEELSIRMTSTTMWLLGRPRTAVRLPVSIKARGIAIGDVVSVTSKWVRDSATGTMGVTAKTGICLGWTRPLGPRGNDFLDVMLIDDPLGVIAPAALATAWDAPTKTLTFADTTLYKLSADTSDLQHLEVGDAVRWPRPSC